VNTNPFVIVIAGASGSGKSSIAQEVAKLLNGAIIYYDDYSHLREWPEETGGSEGNRNLTKVKITKMVEDVGALKAGEKIIEPRNKREISPKDYIIIEDPHGKERKDIAKLFDFVVLIDTPLEICLARVILRAFAGKNFTRLNGSQVLQEEGDPKEKLMILDNFIFGPYWTREDYIKINNQVRKNVDLIVDGMSSIEKIAQEIIQKISKHRKEMPNKK